MSYIYGVLPPIHPLRPYEGILPVKPHITLVKLEKPLKVEVRYRQFVATLGPVVLLPSQSRPRYVALRVEPHGEFAALRTLLMASLGGVVRERHAEFKPHLTVYSIRIKRPTPNDIRPAVEEAARYAGTAFEVKAVHLINTTGGAYIPVYTLHLHA
ncbi:MAG: 2'-5' RNA ligase family protein [Pyrobaculum sp.]|jgi:2'-5' RNA ligase